MRQYRFSELGDVGAAVLIVCISVDYDIGAQPQARIESGHEANRQAAVHRMAHHMVNAVLACDLRRIVGRSVIDDQPFHRVEASDFTGQVSQRDSQCLGLIEAGDLDDEFHGFTLVLECRSVRNRFCMVLLLDGVLFAPRADLLVTLRRLLGKR